MFLRPKISEVFTPRRADVNPKMYIDRPEHEKALERSVHGTKHTIIFGQSGNGKSWLYKRVAEQLEWSLYICNMSNASRRNSITEEIAYQLTSSERILTNASEGMDAKAKAVVAEGGLSSRRDYKVRQEDPLERAFREARAEAGKRPLVIALDNLEVIFKSENLMSELANILLLLDDPRYAKHNAKFILIGTPADIVEYYQKTENLEPVANRLQEIPPVRGLTKSQVYSLLYKGLVQQLGIRIPVDLLKLWTSRIHHSTLGIAQRVHEYGEQLAYAIEANKWIAKTGHEEAAEEQYVKDSLYQSYAVVDRCLNEKNTKAGRRNQVIFSLGLLPGATFDTNTVEKIVREEFPNSTKDVALGIGQILGELCSREMGLLRRTPRSTEYRFADPRYLMCIRMMLRKKNESETVFKRPISY